jgi:putative cell wall-binding protein
MSRLRVVSILCVVSIVTCAIGVVPAHAATDDDIPGVPLAVGVSISDVVDKAADPNDVWAVALTKGDFVRVSITEKNTTANYSYRFAVLSPGSVSVSDRSLHSVVTEKSASFSSYWQDATTEYVEFAVPVDGVYPIWIEAESGNAPYSVQVSVQAAGAFASADADDIWGVPTNGLAKGGVVCKASDPHDVWAVELHAGDFVRVSITEKNTTANYSYRFAVLSPGSVSVSDRSLHSVVTEKSASFSSYWQDATTEYVEFAVPVDGVYPIWIEAESGNAPYTLKVTGSDVLEPPSVTRVAGNSRYTTAVAISKQNFQTAQTVLLATGAQFADALAASGLAGALDAPLLLSEPSRLPSEVQAEITRLGAKKVIIVGGTAAVSEGVANTLRANVTVERISGDDRYATAALVARRVAAIKGAGFGKQVIIARGDNFPDALAASTIAFARTMPILLVRPTALPVATSDAIRDLGIERALVAGGTAAVSNAVVAQLGVPTTRLAGATRYETATKIGSFAVQQGWLSYEFIGLATGATFPDALGGGVVTGRRGGVLLMTEPLVLSAPTFATLSQNGDSVLTIHVYGGTGAVSAKAVAGMATAF